LGAGADLKERDIRAMALARAKAEEKVWDANIDNSGKPFDINAATARHEAALRVKPGAGGAAAPAAGGVKFLGFE
jgi:hypothetical protein